VRKWRAESGGVNRLPFEDEEVLAAIVELVQRHRGPVPASAILDLLAPGKPSQSELARLSAALVRLRKAGRVGRVYGTPMLWQAADA